MNLFGSPLFTPLRDDLEKTLIARFKQDYGVYDPRLLKPNLRAIKVSYGIHRIYIESTYKSGHKSGHSYGIEEEVTKLLEDNNLNAILFDVVNKLTKEDIITKSKFNKEEPFGYVIDYLKDNYNVPKTNGCDIAKKVIKYFKI